MCMIYTHLLVAVIHIEEGDATTSMFGNCYFVRIDAG